MQKQPHFLADGTRSVPATFGFADTLSAQSSIQKLNCSSPSIVDNGSYIQNRSASGREDDDTGVFWLYGAALCRSTNVPLNESHTDVSESQ